MDIFVYKNPTHPMLMEQGYILNELTSKMWVERYREAGEFILKAPVSSGLKELLPVGGFVSHTNTPEIMIVENHEINDTAEEDSIITVTGHSFDSYFEQRVVGSNRTFPRPISDGKFLVPAQKTWEQVVHLLRQHLHPAYLQDDNNALPYVTIQENITSTGEENSRRVDTRDLHSVLLEIMAIDNVGIRIIRPGPNSPLGSTNDNMLIEVHKGVDRTSEIIFSYEGGEIVSADHLWSIKPLKTSCLVQGTHIETMVHLAGYTNYNRRMMPLQARDVDDQYDEGTAIVVANVISEELKKRGREALRSQKYQVLTRAEASKTGVNTRYRTDFDVGDLVLVVGDYSEKSIMRVNEFVEIEDENGTVSYPTLTLEIPE